MRNVFPLTFLLAAAASLKAAENPAPIAANTNGLVVTPTLITQLAEAARSSNAALRASVERIIAANQETRAVRTWDDPTFKFGGSVFSPRGMNPAEQGNLAYGVEQKLPLFGKATAARHVAEAGQAVAQSSADYQFQTTRLEIARALFRVALADRLAAIGSEDLAWLDRMVAVAEEKYRAGTASQVDVLRLQSERAKRVTQLQTERNQIQTEGASLNRQLGRSPEAAWPELQLPEVAPAVPDDSRLSGLALRNEARLKVLRQEIKRAEAMLRQTRKQRLPDVSLGIDGRQFTGDGGFREGFFGVSLNLPWFNEDKYTADRRRDDARLRAAMLETEDAEIMILSELRRLTLAIDAARREALLYRDGNIPRAEQALAAAHAAWLANRGMFNDIMEARRMVLEARSMDARAVSEQWQLLSELVLCCGLADLNALPMLGIELEEKPPGASKP
jgi:cobalt-zinc-cadmium efflux system outer membrane protein